MKSLIFSCLLCLALCTVVGSVGSAVSFSAHDSLLGASGDLQTSSEYDDLEKERLEEVEMSMTKVQQLSKLGETGDAGSGRGRNRRKGKDKKKNRKAASQAHTPGQRQYTHSSSHTTVEDVCLTTHRDFCIHGQCKFMEDLREPLCICQVGYEGKRCAVQLMKTEHREVDADDEAYAHTALLVIAVMLSVISCSALLLTICVHYKTQRRFQAAFFNPSNEKENPLKNDMMI
ncbi:proheparin-binding EGF-like growth factor [Sardina pilchardus]|uniref:proheparin-binding EGF-like growth factor n=1 Tax=Sardina pilchardus TaxID=27697 RepID=UPI002E1561E8